MKQRWQDVLTIPRGMGLSRRLIIAIGAIVVGVLSLFLFFLNVYAPKPQLVNPKATIDAVANQSLEDAIAEIKRHKTHALIATNIPKHKSTHAALVMMNERGEAPLSTTAFKEGSQSAISVYHQTSNNEASRQTFSSNPFSTPQVNTQQTRNNNQQGEKAAFLNDAGKIRESRIDSELQEERSQYAIKAGTIIPATLVTGINSDLPGHIIAKVRRNIFDTRTGNYLLIPQGTTLMGTYDSQVTYGQSRVLIVWQRLIFPDSSSFDLQGMPGVDLAGLAGLHDKVNNHYARIFGSALMFSVLGAAGQLSQPHTATNQLSTQQVLYAAAGQQLAQTGAQMVQKNMSIQPTLTIRPGTLFNVMLTRDMALPRPYQFSEPAQSLVS